MEPPESTPAAVRTLLGRGDNLRAYDLAAEQLVASPGNEAARPELEYLRLLALARSGSTERARQELESWPSIDESTDRRLAEDRSALHARIAKDLALADDGRDPVLLAAAAEAYEAVFERFATAYTAVNAATLWLLAGDEARARTLAAAALGAVEDTGDELGRYWALVTEAEAAFVLGDLDRARHCIADAGAAAVDNLGARASTRRQLRLLLDHLSLDDTAELRPLRNPAVLHFCGHRVSAADSGRFRADVGPRIDAAVDALLAAEGITAAHGSLACGADLLIASALVDRGVELHVLLPFSEAEFIELSVRTGGEDWVPAFRRCLAAAASVTVTCDSAYLGDDNLFTYASQVAMGLALNRARSLDAPAIQLAVWDGEPASTGAGTALDVAAWQRAGGTTTVVEAVADRTRGTGARSGAAVSRPVTAVLFGDIQGISRLRDEELLRFLPVAWGRVAEIVDPLGSRVVDRNIWGDALFLAFRSVADAGQVALAIQRAFAELDPEALGVPADLQLRLAGHVGPTLALADPVRRVEALFGRELTRAARIEPRTPPGAVYVTRAFAALLELDPAADAYAEYVGTITTAKDFETIPMFVLRST